MTGIAGLHAQALDITGSIVAGIPPDRWHAATPCQGWDTQALLNHVVSGNLWAAELAAGATIESIGDRLDGDVLGADPAGSYAVSAKAAAAAFLRPGALNAACAVSTGQSQGRSTPGTGSLTCSSMAGTWPPRPGRARYSTPASWKPAARSSTATGNVPASRCARRGVAGPAGRHPQTRFLAMLGRSR